MSRDRLGPALRELRLTGEPAARARVHAAAHAALAERAAREQAAAARARRPSPRLVPVLSAALLVILLAGVATTRPGAAVARWVRSVVDPVAPKAQPLAGLPARGTLLTATRSGVWIVTANGTRHRLGAYASASWSPHGLFVAAVRGASLSAVDPRGAVHWTLTARAPVSLPRWSPDGYRIAYLSGGSLRVVAGDGSGDRLRSAAASPVAPAWRPDRSHVLAWVGADGRVRVAGADGGPARPLAAAGRVTMLAWASRRRLMVAGPAGVRSVVVAADGRRLAQWAVPSGQAVAAIAAEPHHDALAVLLHSPATALRRAQSTVALLDARTLRRTATLGTFPGLATGLAWSPDARRIATTLRAQHRWIFLGAGVAARAAGGLDRAFGAGAAAIEGWCCAAGSRPPGS